jgi:CBS domain-containing protein
VGRPRASGRGSPGAVLFLDQELAMRCEVIMKKDVECVSPQDAAEIAARRMRDENIGFLPVCDQSRAVLGTLTDRDIAIRLVAENKPASTQVGDLMTREVIACRPQDDVEEAEKLMSRHQKSRIMCIDESNRLVGILSLSDIARYDRTGLASETLRGITEREART